jgi:predicted aspartyl protease
MTDKKPIVCLKCKTPKGLSAFKGGVPVCRKCCNILKASGKTVPLPQLPVPEHKESENKNRAWWAAQDARLDRSEKVYKDYIAAHPTEFVEGDHIIIVDDDTVLHKFDSYEEAMDGGRALAGNKGFYYAEYLHENDIIQIYNVIEGRFKGGRGNQLAYVRANIKNANGQLDEYKVEMLIDTGANACVISEELATAMNATLRTRTDVGTAGIITRGYLIDIMYQIEDWEYKRNIKTVMIPGGGSNLLGMTYLKLCHQEWWGDHRVNLRLLEERELADVDMNPGLLRGMEELSLNMHATELQTQINRAIVLEQQLAEAEEQKLELMKALEELRHTAVQWERYAKQNKGKPHTKK